MNITLEMSPVRYRWIDLIVCLPFLLVPLVVDLPYRVNIFLSWEGAYRLYLGQMPYRDFGLPMGFGYWLLPAGFFHLFGPTLQTLVITQVFINILSLAGLRAILYNMGVKSYNSTLILIVFCLTYVLYNFWPWYNHSVVAFELVALGLLTAYIAEPGKPISWLWLVGSAFFAFLSFFTKQDAGAICIFVCLVILVYHSFTAGKYSGMVTFLLALCVFGAVFILPFVEHGFLYWFNLGQAPHDSRVTVGKLLGVVLGDSVWEKVYLAVIAIMLVYGGMPALRRLWADKQALILMFISVALLGQAIVTRATSPLPTDHMTYFHAFGIAAIVSLSSVLEIKSQPRVVFASLILVGLLFSAGYWRYISGLFIKQGTTKISETNTISRPWTGTDVKGFEGVVMPAETAEGIGRLLQACTNLDRPLRVLNMSELTPLALELGYTPPTGQPLWFHLNIGIFDKEVDEFCQKVQMIEYDVVLFEDIPDLTEFYPYRVRDALRQHYTLTDSFLAPRKLENSTIEVYFRKELVIRQ